ncbi:uncharacterized protein N7483_005766 [Penicillium malachiteum]|uniref:uncharacterized protein n=1 Tax=Penicillium malachiteum TaxID=1324776 RepID=UPI002547204A|nr:uncharacterized protein N7483_005766 [Penicillium malachiteum]KAJ5731258.1 hypothetical protein N7483_005766 [Penicillium malachiteum]
MSQRAPPPARDPMSPPDRPHHVTVQGTRSPHRSEGTSFRRAAAPTSDGRVSGELEGSTLGSSSRDGDRRTPNPRRTQSSGGFLLDSLPRASSIRIGSLRSRPSERPSEKRNTPEPDIVVHKKRSRLPWSRHKTSASESAATPSTSSPQNTQQLPTPYREDQQSETSPSPQPQTQESERTTTGLDRDSLQIVNLALNLNESRRRNVSGFPLGSTGHRPLSVSQSLNAPIMHGSSSRENRSSQDHPYRNYGQFSEDEPLQTQAQGQSPVVNFLPAAVVNDNRAYEFSDSTLARAEKARRHFDLFHEYLRLLPLLPPLRNGPSVDGADSSSMSSPNVINNREYNPLQMVRNRRVRYREKCPINAEAEGWHETGKVHEWINTIEKQYQNKVFDETQSIKLPDFKHSHQRVPVGEAEDHEMIAGSPPSSLRHVSRTNSVKAPRLRLDWKTSPAELIADAAWVEDIANKAKIVDKNGSKIYPDPMELIMVDSNPEHAAAKKGQLSVDMEISADDGLSSRHTSLSSHHPARAHEFKSVGRGRQKHRFQTHAQGSRSRSVSSSRKRSRWDKMKMRAGSISSDSSGDERRFVDWKHRTLEHSRRDLEKLLHRTLPDENQKSRNKLAVAGTFNADRNPPHSSQPLSINTKARRAARKASLSSTGSLDDRYNPGASFEGMESTAPNSPAQVAYFPSIAVNLSPPSSRSPSPAKKSLRHKIVARHERSKSKQGDREFRDFEVDSPIPEVPTPGIFSPSSEQTESTSKLEPSPLPDIMSYADDQGNEVSKLDSSRGRKGQNLPESKLRGIFKGPSRIAERVGNEVSKVGDFILKKDLPIDSRKSSSATTLASDSSDSEDDERRLDKRSGPKGLLRRLPNIADEPGRLIRRDSDKGTPPRSHVPTLPNFTSPLRQDGRGGSAEAVDLGSSREREREGAPALRDGSNRIGLSRSKTFDSGPSLSSSRGHTKLQGIKDPSIPYGMLRPPVTGLAQASPGSPTEKRPPLTSDTSSWSISGRSLQTLKDSGIPRKAEVERTSTLILSSGIKAREIIRRAHSIRDPPAHWLQSSFGSTASIPRVPRIGEFDLAAQNFLRRFEITQYSFQQSMHHFTTATSSPLRSQLKDLETLINQTLTPRVRATADEAEDLCVQLNTTSTLAVKSLSDALDKGIRKRRRRMRWVRRTGFVVLEWALVAVLWWVWLIVMAFKLVRGVFRGAISGARWILWL